MAIKDQCNNCKLFDGNICRAHNTLPNYNQTSCEGYSKKGINLDKKEDSSIMSDSAFHQPKEVLFCFFYRISQLYGFIGHNYVNVFMIEVALVHIYSFC